MLSRPATVLIIENHPLMRAAICNAIADEPDLVIGAIASKGSEAHKIVETLRPDVILFAVGNPGLDELAAMKDLRTEFPAALILALISAEVPGQERAALEAGTDDVLPKTVQRAELLNSLRNLKSKFLNTGASISERGERGFN